MRLEYEYNHLIKQNSSNARAALSKASFSRKRQAAKIPVLERPFEQCNIAILSDDKSSHARILWQCLNKDSKDGACVNFPGACHLLCNIW